MLKLGVALRQADTSYPYSGDVMLMGNNFNIVLSDREKENLHNSLKVSIYKELNKKSLISDRELRLLLEKAPKFLN